MDGKRFKYRGTKPGVGSGLTESSSFHGTSVEACGMGATERNQKPKANPKGTVKTDRGTFKNG